MDSQYKTFKNWDAIDSQEFSSQYDEEDKKKREIDDPKLNQDSSYDKDEDFEDTDDFHKYDDTDEDKQNQESQNSYSDDVVYLAGTSICDLYDYEWHF